MSKIQYIFGLLLLFNDGNNFFLYPQMSQDLKLLVELGYLAYGYNHWNLKSQLPMTKHDIRPFVLILSGICLSMLTALFFHDQSLIVSIAAYRTQILWLTFLVIVRIAPTDVELISACKYFFVFTLFLAIGKRYDMEFVRIEKDILERLENKGEYGAVRGFLYSTIILFYYVEKCIKDGVKYSYLIWIGLGFVILLLTLNRSALFSSIIVCLISTLFSKSRYNKMIIVLVAIVAFSFLFLIAQDTFLSLVEETIGDVGNGEYARNKSVAYFLFEANHNWLTVILGNGFLSFKTSMIMRDLLLYEHICNSDVGFIGFWNQYGVLPIIGFVYVSYNAIKKTETPLFVKMMGGLVLICSGTISYFGNMHHGFYFILLYYLLIYYCRSRRTCKTVCLKK